MARYFKEDFNDRDIRDMISRALTIARVEDGKLKKRHIELIREAKMSSQKTFAEQRTIARAHKGLNRLVAFRVRGHLTLNVPSQAVSKVLRLLVLRCYGVTCSLAPMRAIHDGSS